MYRILCDSYVLYDPRMANIIVCEPILVQKKNELSVDGSSVYNRIGRGFAISRIPYRNEYITQYQEPYDTAIP